MMHAALRAIAGKLNSERQQSIYSPLHYQQRATTRWCLREKVSLNQGVYLLSAAHSIDSD